MTGPPAAEPAFVRATRAAYDTVAVDYAELLREELAAKPLDRAMLAAFAELVAGSGPVADLGCGPGRVAAHLAGLGLELFGVDLSPAMVAVARAAHPEVRFEEGALSALPIGDAELGGIVAWYSIIHTPPEQLPEVFAEFRRVLRPGACLLLAFQVGDAPVHLTQAYGHAVSLDAYRLDPAAVTGQLADAGITVEARLVRRPEPTEKVSQAFLLARRDHR